MVTNKPRVVIVGGGFGGLAAAKRLRSVPVDVTLLDRSFTMTDNKYVVLRT